MRCPVGNRILAAVTMCDIGVKPDLNRWIDQLFHFWKWCFYPWTVNNTAKPIVLPVDMLIKFSVPFGRGFEHLGSNPYFGIRVIFLQHNCLFLQPPKQFIGFEFARISRRNKKGVQFWQYTENLFALIEFLSDRIG